MLLLLAATMMACQKDKLEDIDTSQMSIQILVLDLDKNPVAGAEVLVVNPEKMDVNNPETLGTTKHTNSDGIAVFPVDTGHYAISAYKEGVGVAADLLEVTGQEEHTLELVLLPENFVNYPPQIERIAPEESPVTVSSLDIVNLKLKITDDHSENSNISVKVACRTDGVLFEGTPNDENIVEIEVANLSKGDHKLDITATDEHTGTSTDLFTIDVSIVVPVELSAEKVSRQSVLTWSEILEPDFKKLLIERYNPGENLSEVIAEITDPSTLSFTDTLPPIAEYLTYHVKVIDTENRRSEENTARIELPMGPFFELSYGSVTHAVLHPTKDWVYITVNDDANKIIIYDVPNETVVKEIDLGYEPRYPVIADNGNGLQVFVPGDNNAINIYSADENFSLVQTINTLEDVNDVVPNGDGILIAGMDNYYYDYRKYHIRTFSQATGAVLDSIGDRYGKARIIGDPINKNVVYGFEKSSSNYARLKCEINNSGKFVRYETANTYDYRLDSRSLYMAPSGNHFFMGYVVYNTSDLTSDLEIGSVSHAGMTFSDDGSLVYTCDMSRERIRVYAYSSFQLVKEIQTRTTPGKIIFRDNRIVTVGHENGNYIVEVYDLNE